MPTLFALIASVLVGYLPMLFVEDELAFGPLMGSTLLSIVTFAAIQWWMRRLRGDL